MVGIPRFEKVIRSIQLRSLVLGPLVMLAVLSTFTASGAAAQGREKGVGNVVSTGSGDTLTVEILGEVEVGDFVLLRAAEDEEPAGYARVVEVVETEEVSLKRATVKLNLHPRNQIVRLGDIAQVVDPSKKDSRWPGRVDLQARGAGVSSRYKRLVYPGILFGHGHAQEKHELIIDPLGMVRYGITDWLTIETTPIYYLAERFNISATFRAIDNASVWLSPFVEVSLLTGGANSVLVQLGAVLSFPTNTKLMSHLQAVVGVEITEARFNITDAVSSSRGVTTEIRSRTEYVFDNWDRLMFGPLYNFDAGAVGGFVGYTMVFDHLHVGLAFQTVDFTNLSLNVFDGYTPWFTLFWRS